MAKVIEIYLAGHELFDQKIGDFHFIIHAGNRPGSGDSMSAVILEETPEKNEDADEDTKFIVKIDTLSPPYVALKWANEKYLNEEKEE